MTKVTKGKVMNVYDYLLWLNEDDLSVMEYIPKTKGNSG